MGKAAQLNYFRCFFVIVTIRLGFQFFKSTFLFSTFPAPIVPLGVSGTSGQKIDPSVGVTEGQMLQLPGKIYSIYDNIMSGFYLKTEHNKHTKSELFENLNIM